MNKEIKGGGKQRITEAEKKAWRRHLRRNSGYRFFSRTQPAIVPQVNQETIAAAAIEHGKREEFIAATAEALSEYLLGRAVFDPYGTEDARRKDAQKAYETTGKYELHTKALERDQTRPNNMTPAITALGLMSDLFVDIDPKLAGYFKQWYTYWEMKRIKESVPRQSDEEKLRTVRELESDALYALKTLLPNAPTRITKIT